jgi:hypothetical protein
MTTTPSPKASAVSFGSNIGMMVQEVHYQLQNMVGYFCSLTGSKLGEE